MPTEASSERWAVGLRCSRSGVEAALDEPAFLSPAGAPWLVEYDLDPRRGEVLRERLRDRSWSLWRYREVLPVRDFDSRVDLGEGGTPLVRLRRVGPAGVDVRLKDESGNPTGSFKARGLALAVNRARELGAPGVELPSAGNAAAALAAYAAAAGLPCRVAVPADTPRVIVERCRAHGAEVLTGGDTLVESGAALAAAPRGYWNLATLREPYRVEGKKTMGYELYEQLGGALPDWIVYPTGGGTGIIGMHRAFAEMERLGWIGAERPHFAAVQMSGCAPIVRAFETGAESAEPWAEPATDVWGLRVPRAVGDFLILRALYETGGAAVAVGEEAASRLAGRLASEEGLLVGPEGAAALAGMEQLAASGVIEPGHRVVVFQTGHPANYGAA